MANRYDNIPLSEKTRQGMTLTIDDLAAIGRLLTLQDDYYDELFERVERKLTEILKKLDNHEKRICALEKKLSKHIEDHEKIRA
jgi:hypothetical protein